jgi:hypothetical protein
MALMNLLSRGEQTTFFSGDIPEIDNPKAIVEAVSRASRWRLETRKERNTPIKNWFYTCCFL